MRRHGGVRTARRTAVAVLAEGVRRVLPERAEGRLVGTIDLDATVAAELAEQVRSFPPVEVELVDITSGDPVRRRVRLVSTTKFGNPINDKTWPREWVTWRDAAGWPKDHGTFHALRHFFATRAVWSAVSCSPRSAGGAGDHDARSKPGCTGVVPDDLDPTNVQVKDYECGAEGT